MQDELIYSNKTHSDPNSTVYKLRSCIAMMGEMNLDKDVDALAQLDEIIKSDPKGDCYKVFYSKHEDLEAENQDPAGNSCLLFAIASKLPTVSQKLIEDAANKLTPQEYKDFLDYQYKNPVRDDDPKEWYQNTALTLAAKQGEYGLMEELLIEGAAPNTTGRYGLTAASILCFHLGLVPEEQNQKIVKILDLLKDKGADFTRKDQLGYKSGDYLTKDLEGPDIRGFKLIEPLAGFPEQSTERELSEKIKSYMADNSNAAQNVDFYKKHYISASQNDYGTDGKIFNSVAWGTNAIIPKLEKYQDSSIKNEWKDTGPITYKQDFMNTPKGREIKNKIDTYSLNKSQPPLTAVERLHQSKGAASTSLSK